MLPGERRVTRLAYGDRSRWRRDQRDRRRRLTGRGRATIAALFASLATFLSWLVDPMEPMRAADVSSRSPGPGGGAASESRMRDDAVRDARTGWLEEEAAR